ncbi:uncharacterized protein LOC110901380 [Helianthus annuus]|uniref:uncharacterized protein LOC110901380 n=1 Tax=Helianthus annuus TaxID=4232 RepID=UPI000B8FD2A2|nr:uncharacterized protein LOC110901380 [Helianthus annuus]
MLDGLAISNLFTGVVGSGDSILFWLDPWLFEVPLKFKFPALFHLEVVKSCSVRDRLEGEGLWLWKNDPVSATERFEWDILSAALRAVSLSNRPDKWEWVGNVSEVFSVATVKKSIDSINDYSNHYVFDWCKWVPLKCNILVWRAEMDRIPTVDALVRRGVMLDDDMCNCCGSGSDSVEHIFTACPLALGLWERITLSCRVRNFFVFSIRDLLAIHEHEHRRASEKEALKGIIIVSCWFLWKARNDLRFSGKRSGVEDIFSEVRSASYFWYKHRAKKGSCVWGGLV